MDPTQDAATPEQYRLAITFTPNPDSPGGKLEIQGIPDEEPLAYWLLKKLEQGVDGFYHQRSQSKIAPVPNSALREFLNRGR